MRICLVIPSLSGGGAEFVAREWSKWLTAAGDEVTVALTTPKATDEAPVGVKVVKLVGDNPIAHVRSFRKLVRQGRFDAVIGLLPYFNLLAILGSIVRLKRRPRIFISGRNVEVPFPEVHGRNVSVTRLISKFLYPLADGYIAISHPVAAEAGALYRIAPKKMAVIPNPSTAKVVSAHLVGEPVRILQETETLNIIVPARLVEQKRPFVALEAAVRLSRAGRDVVLHYFGDGPLRGALETAAAEAGISVRFHGWVDNWFMESPKSGVVVLTSLAEGFGNVLVEAAAVGLPSVASSRCLGSADAIVPGITGEFTSGDTPEDYADAILRASTVEVDSEKIYKWLHRFSSDSSGSKLRAFIVSRS